MDFAKIRNYLFLALLFVATVLFFYIVKPFAYPIFWAAVLAALFYPLYQKFNTYFKHANFSAFLTLVLVALIIVLPISIFATIIVAQASSIIASINDFTKLITDFFSHTSVFLEAHPALGKLAIDEPLLARNISQLSSFFASTLITKAREFTELSVLFVVYLLLMFYTLFYFLRDGEKILRKIMYLSPLGDRYELMLYKKFTSTARAAIRGTLLVGAVQGTMGGILFAAVGIPLAWVWGIAMGALSIIPVTGSFLVWLPAGVILLFTGHIAKGIIVLAIGAVVISTIDNILRPYLVGKDLEIHPLIILFATLGGIILFGASGFVIGPIIAAMFLSFWEMYEEYYRNELSNN